MFDKLTERLQGVIESLRGRGRLTEDNISDTLRQVRMALLEADVALPVVKTFVESIRGKVLGMEIEKSLTPGQSLVSLIHEELIALMGDGVRPINLRAQPPVVILLAGLQGAGKTTSAGKLAKWLKENEKKKVLLASTDVYRPAAILQLERLGGAARRRVLSFRSEEACPDTGARSAERSAALAVRRAHRRHRRSTARRRGDDDGDPRDQCRGQSDRNAVRRRQHGRPGRRECRPRVRQRADPDGRRADED